MNMYKKFVNLSNLFKHSANYIFVKTRYVRNQVIYLVIYKTNIENHVKL